jgi:hypothetical protein
MAQPEKDEPVLLIGVIRVGDQEGPVVEKHFFGFLKRNSMFPLVARILPLVPFEAKLIHLQRSITTM